MANNLKHPPTHNSAPAPALLERSLISFFGRRNSKFVFQRERARQTTINDVIPPLSRSTGVPFLVAADTVAIVPGPPCPQSPPSNQLGPAMYSKCTRSLKTPGCMHVRKQATSRAPPCRSTLPARLSPHPALLLTNCARRSLRKMPQRLHAHLRGPAGWRELPLQPFLPSDTSSR